MKGIILFGKGLGRAIKDSWFALIVLFITCIVGIVGVNFCYRTAMFEVRQPESLDIYNGTEMFVYRFSSWQGDDVEFAQDWQTVLNVNDDKVVGLIGESSFKHNRMVVSYNMYCEDYCKESKLTEEDFASSAPKIVLNENVLVEIGGSILIDNVSYEVVGKTDNISYVPFGVSESSNGILAVYTSEQLTRSEMSRLEKAVDAKLNRDFNWSGKFGPDRIVFLILGVIILILSAINIHKVFGLYIKKNNGRYSLYGMLGMTKLRTCGTILTEGTIFLSVNLSIGLLIDAFIFRPLFKIIGVSFMYDFSDIAITFFMVLLPFVASIGYEIYKRIGSSAGDKKLLSKKV